MVHYMGWLKPWHYRWNHIDKRAVLLFNEAHPLYSKILMLDFVHNWWDYFINFLESTYLT